MKKEAEKRKEIKIGAALIPVGFLIFALFFTIVVLKQAAHIPLIAAAAVAAIVATFHKYPWKEIQAGIVHGIMLAMSAILILMVVGTMIGTWIQGGTVPSMIFYGLKILSPGIFLVATLIICSVVSLGTGSSWSTAGTIVSRADGYAMPGVHVDGNDCTKVFEATAEAVERARSGGGPTLLECLTYRVEPHCGIIADQRPEGERENWIARSDPLDTIRKYMPDFGSEQEKQVKAEVKEELDDAVEFARSSVALSPEKMFEELRVS